MSLRRYPASGFGGGRRASARAGAQVSCLRGCKYVTQQLLAHALRSGRASACARPAAGESCCERAASACVSTASASRARQDPSATRNSADSDAPAKPTCDVARRPSASIPRSASWSGPSASRAAPGAPTRLTCRCTISAATRSAWPSPTAFTTWAAARASSTSAPRTPRPPSPSRACWLGGSVSGTGSTPTPDAFGSKPTAAGRMATCEGSGTRACRPSPTGQGWWCAWRTTRRARRSGTPSSTGSSARSDAPGPAGP
jgi:hypothetical protein